MFLSFKEGKKPASNRPSANQADEKLCVNIMAFLLLLLLLLLLKGERERERVLRFGNTVANPPERQRAKFRGKNIPQNCTKLFVYACGKGSVSLVLGEKKARSAIFLGIKMQGGSAGFGKTGA